MSGHRVLRRGRDFPGCADSVGGCPPGGYYVLPGRHAAGPGGRRNRCREPRDNAGRLASPAVATGESAAGSFSGESRLKGEGLFLTEFSSSCCKKSLAARRFSAAISSGESPRAISSGVEECPRVYHLGQEAHGEGGLSYAIGPCDDVADLRGHSSWRKRFRCPAPGACRICRAVLRR